MKPAERQAIRERLRQLDGETNPAVYTERETACINDAWHMLAALDTLAYERDQAREVVRAAARFVALVDTVIVEAVSDDDEDVDRYLIARDDLCSACADPRVVAILSEKEMVDA